MAINLPSLPFGANTEIKLKSSAVDHTPFLGGPVQRISRLGDKWSVKIDCRKMYPSQSGPIITALLLGLSEKVLMTVPQPGIDTSQWADGQIFGAVAGGKTIVITGGGAAKQVGQFLSIVKNGVRYLHQVAAVAGNTLSIIPALKVSLDGGETVEFGAPKIEGFIAGNEQSWTVGLAENLGLSFEIGEAQ